MFHRLPNVSVSVLPKTLLIGSAAALLLAGCKDKAADVTSDAAAKGAEAVKAVVAPAQDMPAKDLPDISIIPSGDYELEKTHGYVTFSYSHQGYSYPTIRFNDVNAVLTLDSAEPTNSSVSVLIAAGSIDTMVAKFDDHITNEDMFNVSVYPEITFKSTKLVQTDAAHGTMTGDLSMMGLTKPVTFDVRFNKAGESRSGKPMAGFSATTKVMRSDWNLGYAVPYVGDEVTINVEAEFVKAAE